MPSALHGMDAVNAVQQREGRALSPQEQRVVMLEGFVPQVYKDTKGIETFGVGQTGKWINKSFGDSFKHHEDRARKSIPSYDKLPPFLQAELVQAEYRGDLGSSPTFRKLFNSGKYKKAAKEFLNHEEYLDVDTPPQIRQRLEAVSRAVAQYSAANGGR